MKRYIKITAILAGFLVLGACEKPQENPVLDTTLIQPAQLTSPQPGSGYVLLQENEPNIALSIEWDEATFPLTEIPTARYAVEMDVTGNDFASPATIATVDTTFVEVTVQRLNDICGVLGLETEVEADVELRIRTFISGASDNVVSFSEPVALKVTPYEFKVKPIYMLGNGTLAGWNNLQALEMGWVEGATYAIVSTLSGGSGNFFKFISVLGQWAPQWGTDANPPTVTDGVTSGNLVYRPTEAQTDPPAIPVPAEAGDYRIVADTTGLKYRVEPVSSKMFVLGDNTEAGWNIGNAREMTKTAPGMFYTVITVTGVKGAAIQFAGSQAGNATRWGASKDMSSLRRTLAEGTQLNLPTQPGTYRVEINLATNSYRFIKQ